ncbi:hypothetical protein HDV00_009961 [Rhizophlyctis rosea]|nr:hypothetical protein HDV00_009961 [Rhizophlyctis rosea]
MKEVGRSLHESGARFEVETVSEVTPLPAAVVAVVEGVPPCQHKTEAGERRREAVSTGRGNQFLGTDKDQLAELLVDVNSARVTPSPDAKSSTNTTGGQQHGTWMGTHTPTLSFAFLTNHREHPELINPTALSRGLLISNFLLQSPSPSPLSYLENLTEHKFLYNGFNLVVGSPSHGAYYLGNRGKVRNEGPVRCPDGVVCGVSNGVFMSGDDSGWPKVEDGKRRLREILERDQEVDDVVEGLLDVLRTKQTYPDEALPVLFSEKLEQALCPICIDKERSASGRYGTRTHTIMVVPREGEGRYVEVNRYWVDTSKVGADGKGVIMQEEKRSTWKLKNG